jgi:hypothetical protein
LLYYFFTLVVLGALLSSTELGAVLGGILMGVFGWVILERRLRGYEFGRRNGALYEGMVCSYACMDEEMSGRMDAHRGFSILVCMDGLVDGFGGWLICSGLEARIRGMDGWTD